MSEVKVNKISPRSGTTVTLGDSGDTFTIPSGATINNQGTATNFGATGSASWTTTVKTGDFTAVAGEGYFVNTTSGEIDVTLPAGSPGAVVAVKDYANTWDTNNCVIISNSSEKIGGSTNNAILSTEGLAVTFIYIDSTQGWLITDDGLQSVAETNPYIVATGGTETTSGNCKIHTFTGPGTFSVTKTALAAANNLVSHLVIAGGAGGAGGGGPGTGSGASAGGGGAGGYREVKSPVTPYTASPLDGYPSSPNRITVTAQDYPIAVGGGGASQPPSTANGVSGAVSTFSTITSAGGGGGGYYLGGGNSGGSGGGAGQTGSIGSGNTPPTTPPQGNDGGLGPAPNASGGGGGGAGGVGQTGTPANPGPGNAVGGVGGLGTTSSINGTPTGRAGGGAGGTGGDLPGGPAGAPGPATSGGGAGGSIGVAGTAGTVNTGGGGGGGGGNPGKIGGAGGSGIVMIRYRFQ